MIRVGRITYTGKTQDPLPTYPNYEQIVVMTKSSKYGSLSPYELKDNQGRIMENLWQFSKVYSNVPKITQRKSRFNKQVIWRHPAEDHYDSSTDTLTPEYHKWRKKGFNCKHSIRYPVGFHYRHKCLFATKKVNPIKKLNYVESRKEIYVPLYINMVRKEKQYQDLVNKLKNGINLLILEVDGPHQESMDYYKKTYNVPDDWIDKKTIEVNENNMKIMLNDEKHNFGHGYCLGIALLNLENKLI